MNISHTQRIARDRQLIAAIEKYLAKGSVFVVNGVDYKPSEIIAMLKERIDVTQPVFPARAAWLKCVAEQERVIAETTPVVEGFLALLRVMHGASPDLLNDFGLGPKPKRNRTPKERPSAPDAGTANGTTQPK